MATRKPAAKPKKTAPAKRKTTGKTTSKRKTTKKKATSKKKESSLKKKLIVWTLKVAMSGITVIGLFLMLVYLGFFGRLPSEEELSKIRQQSAAEVYSADGKLMGRYFVVNRRTIDNNAISDYVKDALVATEDSRFFEHSGLDFISLGRVIFRTILLGDHAQGGGSTISQQLAKNLYPRKRLGLLTFPVCKAKEIFTANRMEQIYDKDDILTLYLNTVPFGEDIYGIEVAAQRFFSKRSRDLNPGEAATLVGMLAANTAYNPRINPERSKKRRNIVLGRMQEQGFLSANEAKKWKTSSNGLHYRRIDHNTGISPYFREKIKHQAEEVLADLYGDEYNLFSDGLRVVTTIDSRVQHYADEAVKQQLKRLQQSFNQHWKDKDPWVKHPEIYASALRKSNRYQVLKEAGWSEEKIMTHMEKKTKMTIFSYGGEKRVTMSPVDSVKYYLKLLNTGFVAVNPSNGHLLAWVGGIDHKSFQYDHITSKRPVGSTFKPFVYAAALMDGMEPCDFISNERRVYKKYNDWSPANSNGKHDGYYSLKGGLANSVNTISAEIINRVGVDEVVDLAHEMGIESEMPPVPSIALGTAELSLLEMVGAYSTFVNYGRPVEPVGLLRIEDRKGNVLYEYEEPKHPRQVYSEEVAHFMIEMMRGVVERGTGKSLRTGYALHSQLAGKTGTTQDNADGWFIGYTPGLVAGCWVGNDQPAIRWRSTRLGQGGKTALPVFGKFMQQMEKDRKMAKYTKRSFYPMPEDLQRRFLCEDYSLDDPDKNIFDRFLDSFDRPDSTKLRKAQERDERKKERRKRKERDHKGILDKMKDLFKKK
ncbi:peptidoglycan glycosyltransferase [Marinilabiliaceae bacterium JC017]|nr:peptidoglycan glycosyltransferase [Marinilabiliaceae bacterium JC017]